MKKNQLIYLKKGSFILFLIVFALAGCQSKAGEGKQISKSYNINTNMREYQKTEELLGTVITCKVYGENGDKGLEKAFERAGEIEAAMSARQEDSELSKINKEAAEHPVIISDDLYQVIEKALYYAEKTEGAFDPTIGRLIDLWGIGTEKERVPSKSEIAALRDRKNYKNVILDKETKTIFYKNKDIKLDLGAIAKGYAGDEMKRILKEEFHINNGILSLGGNIVTIGNKPDEGKWKVGIINPLDTSKVYGTLESGEMTIVTSGNYERYFIKDGVRYHHIINPKTGYPAEEGVVSATIYGDCSMDADALSTASYIMGKDKAIELLEGLEGFQGIFIEEKGNMVTTSGITKEIFHKETE